jgi:uncharacterized protein YjbJ (UPF0337 family)
MHFHRQDPGGSNGSLRCGPSKRRPRLTVKPKPSARRACRVQLERNVARVRALTEQPAPPPAAIPHANKERSMNWDRIEGNWKQFTGKVKEKWGKLTDDDITQINGNREQLEGKIQARYGYAKDQVKKDVDDWLDRA